MPMSQDLNLRPAEPKDEPAIAELVRQAYGKYVERIGRQPLPMIADYGKAIAQHQVWVREQDGGIAAVLELIAEDGHLLLENVAVAPCLQGAGLGKQLVAFAEAEARRQGYREIRLYTNQHFTENIALYETLGFRETHRQPIQDSAIVHMSKGVSR